MPRDLRIWLAGGFILFLVLVAVFAPLLAPFDALGFERGDRSHKL